jgi:hypothetical protein
MRTDQLQAPLPIHLKMVLSFVTERRVHLQQKQDKAALNPFLVFSTGGCGGQGRRAQRANLTTRPAEIIPVTLLPHLRGKCGRCKRGCVTTEAYIIVDDGPRSP